MFKTIIFGALVFLGTTRAQCPSVTTASGTHAPTGQICSGDLIFEDNFDTLDLKKWAHEQTLGGGGNWEFEWYTNSRYNSYVDGGKLFIKPTLLADENGEDFLYSGQLDINGGSPADERHVCTNQRNASHPQKLRQASSNCKPTYKKYYVKCGNQLCAGVRLVYENHHKDLMPKTTSGNDPTNYVCCPGWTQTTNRSHGCNKPYCAKPCQNGGKCVKPGTCSCPRGFAGPSCEIPSFTPWTCPKTCLNGGTCVPSKGICACIKGFRGPFCEKDVDECKEYKPCDQICYNTPGSYNCQCRENFLLQTDGQSCRKEDDGETTIEAKDLEFEMLDKRLIKLETLMDESHKNDVTKNDLSIINGDIKDISTNIKDLKTKMNNMEHYKSDMYIFKNKLNLIEKKANKIDDLLIKYEKMKKCAFYNKICI